MSCNVYIDGKESEKEYVECVCVTESLLTLETNKKTNKIF